MLKLSSHVTFHARGAEAFAWHGLTGDVLQMSTDVLALLHAFRGGGRIREVADKRPGGIVRAEAIKFARILEERLFLITSDPQEKSVLRALHPMLSPDAVWFKHPDGSIDAYGRAGKVCTLPPDVAAMLTKCHGHYALYEVAPNDAAIEALLRLARPDIAALKLYPEPPIPKPPASLASTMPWPVIADVDAFLRGETTRPDDVSTYHRETIGDSAAQFEDVETTLSHLFREPHPALGGRTFGAALAAGLEARGAFARCDRATARVVEIGAGLGFVGAALQEAWKLPFWKTIDLSPALAKAQAARGHHVTRADAKALPLPDHSVDVLISNEMAGDLGTENFVNTGAIALVKEVARVLRPGGLAYISEFGSLHNDPVRSDHLDHDEWSIRFSDLDREARALGLETAVVVVPDLIGLDPIPPALSTTRASFGALRALLADHGVTLDKRAWTRDMLTRACEGKLSLESVTGLRFRPIGDRTMGLIPREFLALIAKAP